MTRTMKEQSKNFIKAALLAATTRSTLRNTSKKKPFLNSLKDNCSKNIFKILRISLKILT